MYPLLCKHRCIHILFTYNKLVYIEIKIAHAYRHNSFFFFFFDRKQKIYFLCIFHNSLLNVRLLKLSFYYYCYYYNYTKTQRRGYFIKTNVKAKQRKKNTNRSQKVKKRNILFKSVSKL